MISRTNEEKWHFTKAQANAMYEKAIVIVNTRRPEPGVYKDYMKCKVNGEWFYRVNYLSPGDQRNYVRDLWEHHNYITYFNNKHKCGFYVRRA